MSIFCVLSQNYQYFFWKIIWAFYSKLYTELKNGIGILVCQVVFKLWIKTVKKLFWSISQELPGLLKFCYFWVPETVYYKMNICDPTWVNEADVIRGVYCDFAVNVFFRNQESFWHTNHFDTIFNFRDMRKTKFVCKSFKKLKIHILSS